MWRDVVATRFLPPLAGDSLTGRKAMAAAAQTAIARALGL